MVDFTDIEYLKEGSDIQRKTYTVLRASRIMEILAPFSPVVVGTIPIGIDIPGSDIDIICRAGGFDSLEKLLREQYSRCTGFLCRKSGEAFICNLIFDGMTIEVFAQDIPVSEQNGYRHMVTEHALIGLYGEKFRVEIIKLKRSGLNTEPAFAKILGLPGDPYQAVLQKGREMGLYQ
ncbi:MAG: DUF4269 domain-containing protein [Rikenellaceae bacterium]|nr:DUF4269 domain-containing protein [Rikenellaceae bacterium]